MNKDVVYIEPDDDITDIIARLKKSRQKVVALVPPKKIGVLRSAVNTKLVAKAAREVDKVVVIVTKDQSLIKLAATANIPVADNLQSRPKLPSEIIEQERPVGEQVINERDFDDEDVEQVEHTIEKPVLKSGESNNAPSLPSSKKSADQDISSDDLEEKPAKKSGKKSNIPNIEKYRKFIIAGAIAGVLFIGFLIWAIFFAPAATISVAVRTTGSNFSENITFVTDKNKEDAKNGIFYVEKEEKTDSSSVKFKATGEKDLGEKASGTLTLIATITSASGLTIPAGSVFSYAGYNYLTNEAVNYTVSESDGADCLMKILSGAGCQMDATIKVTAENAGEGYNISSTGNAFNSSITQVSATNKSAMSGGTTKKVTVVSQADVDRAKNELDTSADAGAKEGLIKKLDDDMIAIESSFTQDASDPTSSPAVDGEASEATLTASIKYAIYAVNREAVEEYIKEKSGDSLAKDQKIYEITNLRFEGFKDEKNTLSARLKAITQTGPKVDEKDILEKSLGSKKKDVYSKLKPINGVSNVDVKTSFFWVNSIPKDQNRVVVELKVEE